MTEPTQREQELCKVFWSILYEVQFGSKKFFADKSPTQVGRWVCEQLTACGFQAQPVGSTEIYLVETGGLRGIAPSPSVQMPVMFRIDKKTNGRAPQVTAVFLEEPADYDGEQIMCYSHVGQHSGCTYGWMREYTRPATPEEYADLKEELENIGYIIRAVTRRTPQMVAAFNRKLAEGRRMPRRRKGGLSSE